MAKTLIGQYRSNSSSTTDMKVEWESISATLIRVYFTYLLGSATALGTGNSRDARVWVYDNDGTQIGYASVEVKGRYDTWTYSGTYYGTVDVTIPYRSNVALKVTAKTVVGTWTTGINSCIWDATANTNYPSLASISWPTYNTAPYWSAGDVVTVSPNGTIPENTSSLAVSWPAAHDDQSDTLYYDVYRVVNGVSTKIDDGITFNSINNDVSALPAGTSIRFDVYVRDASLYASGPIQSAVVTKNVLTAAVLAGTGTVDFNSTSISLSRNNASNTNGNGTFTYTLGLTGITVYNPNVSAVGQAISVAIWRSGGYPSGPYIKFDDLKTYLASSFVGNLVFSLTTANAYGSSGSTNKTIAADIRTNPTGLGSVAYSGGYTIASVLRYLPDVRAITVGWSAATDPLGTSIVYDVYYKLAADSTWTQARTGLSALSTTITPPSGATQLSYNVKVVARSAYGYTQEASGAALAIDKYLRPIIKVMSKVRTSTGVNVTLLIEHRSSFNAALALSTFTYTKFGGAAVNLTLSNLNPSYTYTEPGVFLQNSSYTMVVTIQDNAGTVIGAASVTASLEIRAYTPMLSVRKKGVGIDCINDGTGDYKEIVSGKVNSVTDANGNSGWYENGVKIGAPTIDALPVGFVMPWFNDSAPSAKWLFGEGQSLASYPDASAIFGANLPDTRGRVLVGKAASGTFGTTKGTTGDETKTIGVANLPAHDHSINHDHASVASGNNSVDHSHGVSITTDNPGNHNHSVRYRGISSITVGDTGFFFLRRRDAADSYTGEDADAAGVNGGHTHSVSGNTGGQSAAHTHPVDLPSFSGTSGQAGSGTALNVVQPSIVCRWIFKVSA